ncbi:hybrid sensor histidine kinase/response regulator [Halobacteriales archaeon QS_1_68_17]|nr:MAG: hybrid sensor histidine kinase/response regulator [Halobacteriales archaeon QS_1_68_17]
MARPLSATHGDETIRVLHVDDDPGLSDVTAEFLERENDRLEVVTETSATEGLERLEATDIDCVVSDYQMPGTNGLEFLDEVRDRFPDFPFLLFTGKGSEEIASEAITRGVTDYLQKGTGTDQYAVLANRIERAYEESTAKQTLEQRERQLSTLISNLPGVVYRSYHEPGWPKEFVSEGFADLAGYTSAELERGEIDYKSEIVHPEDADRLAEAVDEAVAAGEPFEVTYRIVSRDGAVRWLWERGRGIENGDDDTVALEGFLTDVTEQKKRERELTEVKQRLELALEATDTGVWEWDYEADEITRHRSVYEVLDLDPDEGTIDPGHLLDRIHPDYQDAAREAYERTFEERSSLRTEYPILTGTDEWLWVREQARVEKRGGVRRLIGAITDVSEFKERERRLERQNERLEEFAGIVSHDLRNPLTVAELQVDLARQNCECGTPEQHLDDATAALHRADELIDNLMTIARQEETITETEAVVLADVAAECWRHVETGDATLSIESDMTLQADRPGLKRVFENLFGNSIQHGSTGDRPDEEGEGGSAVRVRVGTLEDATGFYVADDGPGIPPEDQDMVFDPGISTAEDGTGYGLNVVEEVARAHGWSVDVTRSEDGGARFEIRIEDE